MQVTVDSTLTAIHKCQLLTFQRGDVVSGDIAGYLLRSGAAVTPADDDAKKLAKTEPDDQAAALNALLDAGITPAQAEELADPVSEIDGGDNPSAEIDVASSTIDQVLAWVGDSPERALAAHAAEEARGDKARTRLLGRLSEIGLS